MAKEKENTVETAAVNTEKENKETTEAKKGFQKSEKSGIRLNTAAEYWDFESDPVFVGKFVDMFIKDVADEKTGEVESKCIGFLMEDENGDEWLISNSHAITTAFETEYQPGKTVISEKDVVVITFKGKLTKSDGKPYNMFKVELY